MIYAERGNRVKQISEQDIPKYIEQGYKITDEWGRVLKSTVPTDIQVLKLAYVQNQEEIATLKNRIAELEAQLKAAKPSKKAEEVVPEVAAETPATSKPEIKSTRGKKTQVED